MKKIPLIFLMGFKNTGKDTVANLINELAYNSFNIVGFADALKKDYYSSVGVEYDRNTEDREFKEKHRNGIIQYGESMKHEKGMFHWIETALDPLIFSEDTKGIIVPDCRRAEEVHWFVDFKKGNLEKYNDVRGNFKPLFIGIHRPGAEDEDNDYLTKVAIRAATDNFVFNGFIKNDKGLKELKQSVLDFFVNAIK